jgi:hypothetical protein
MFGELICLSTNTDDLAGLADQVRLLRARAQAAKAGEDIRVEIDGVSLTFTKPAQLSEHEEWMRIGRQVIEDNREGLERLAKR